MNAAAITKTISEEILVKPRTRLGYGAGEWSAVIEKVCNKFRSFVRYGVDVEFWTAADNAARGINYALTGRVSDVATLTIREMSAYQVTKLIAEIAADRIRMADVPAWLERKAVAAGWR
jgi:hypothetical protein